MLLCFVPALQYPWLKVDFNKWKDEDEEDEEEEQKPDPMAGMGGMGDMSAVRFESASPSLCACPCVCPPVCLFPYMSSLVRLCPELGIVLGKNS